MTRILGSLKFDNSRKISGRFLPTIFDERGNVESSLVLIPLMILFLSVAQIGLSVYSRNITGNLAQGQVAYQAIGDANANSGATNPLGSFEKSVVDPNSSSTIEMPLPGGGSVLVEEQTIKAPVITPLLPQGDVFKVQGIAVQE